MTRRVVGFQAAIDRSYAGVFAFDWDTMNRLYEKGYITNPVGKAKSVGLTEEGFLKARELFEQRFTK